MDWAEVAVLALAVEPEVDLEQAEAPDSVLALVLAVA